MRVGSFLYNTRLEAYVRIGTKQGTGGGLGSSSSVMAIGEGQILLNTRRWINLVTLSLYLLGSSLAQNVACCVFE